MYVMITFEFQKCPVIRKKYYYSYFTNEEAEDQNPCHLLKVTPLVSNRDMINNQVF